MADAASKLELIIEIQGRQIQILHDISKGLAEIDARTRSTGEGFRVLTPHVGGATSGFRAMSAELFAVSSIMGSGPMSANALLQMGRGFAFMGSSLRLITLSLPAVLGIAAALAAVGYWVHSNEEATKKATEAQQKYTKALEEAWAAYDKLVRGYQRGRLPGEEQIEDVLQKESIARSAAQSKLTALQNEAAQLTEKVKAYGYGAGTPFKVASYGEQLDTVNKSIAAAQEKLDQIDARIARIKEITPEETEKKSVDTTADYEAALKAQNDLMHEALSQRNNLRSAAVKAGNLDELAAYDATQRDEAETYQKTLDNLITMRMAKLQAADQAERDGAKETAAALLKQAEDIANQEAKLRQSRQGQVNIAPYNRNEIVEKQAREGERLVEEIRIEAARTTGDQLAVREEELQKRFQQIRETYAKQNPSQPMPAWLDSWLLGLQAVQDKALQTEDFLTKTRQRIQQIESLGTNTIRAAQAREAAGEITRQEAAQIALNTKLQEQADLKAEVAKAEVEVAKGGDPTRLRELNTLLADTRQKIVELTPSLKEQAAAQTSFWTEMQAGAQQAGLRIQTAGQTMGIAMTSLAKGLDQSGGAAFKAWITGSESAGKAFKDMLRQIAVSVLTTIVEALALTAVLELIEMIPIVGPTVISILGAASLGSFAMGLKSVQGSAKGEVIHEGSGPTSDDVVRRVSRGEVIVPADKASKVGYGFWHSFINGTAEFGRMAAGGFVTPELALAGVAPPITSPAYGRNADGSSAVDLRPAVHITNYHLFGNEEIDRHFATSAAQRNIREQVLGQSTTIARNTKRAGGHQSEA